MFPTLDSSANIAVSNWWLLSEQTKKYKTCWTTEKFFQQDLTRICSFLFHSTFVFALKIQQKKIQLNQP